MYYDYLLVGIIIGYTKFSIINKKETLRQYFLYFMSGLLVVYPLLLVWGFSAGPANMLPIITLIASLSLILIASNISLFSQKIGAVVGLILLLIVLPWSVMIIIEEIEEITRGAGFHWFLLFVSLRSIIVCYSIFYSVKFSILNDELDWNTDDKVKPLYRYILVSIPIILVALWIISIGGNFAWVW